MLTIVTPAADRTLLTIQELRAAVGVTDASQDADLTTKGNSVAAIITAACNVAVSGATPPTLRSEVVRETFRTRCGPGSIMLARRPITAIASVTEDGVALTADQYELDDAAGFLDRIQDTYPSAWRGTVVVQYTAGWATVPEDLKEAARKLVRMQRSEGSRDPLAKRIEVPDVQTIDYWVGSVSGSSGLPSDVMDLLRPYRNLSVG